jgi:hypothetical protein
MQDPGSRPLLKGLPRSLANAAIRSMKPSPCISPSVSAAGEQQIGKCFSTEWFYCGCGNPAPLPRVGGSCFLTAKGSWGSTSAVAKGAVISGARRSARAYRAPNDCEGAGQKSNLCRGTDAMPKAWEDHSRRFSASHRHFAFSPAHLGIGGLVAHAQFCRTARTDIE